MAHPLKTTLEGYRARAKKLKLDVPALAGLRIHDLRRTAGSWMAAGNASLHIIGGGFGHRSTEATKIYAHLQLDLVRAALTQATDAMLRAGKTQVVALDHGRKRRRRVVGSKQP